MAEDFRESLSLDVSNFLGSLGAAQVALGTFAGQIAAEALPALGRMLDSIINAAHEVGKFAESMENLGAATGISERNLLTLESVMELTGGSVDGIGFSMRVLARHMQEADQGNVAMQQKLKLLGITSRDANEALHQMADTLASHAKNSNMVALGSEVMGRGFAAILPAIKDGSAAFKEAEERAADFGTNLPLARLKDMDEQFDKLGQATKGFTRTLVDDLAPAIEATTRAITQMVANFTSAFLKGNFLESWKLNLMATGEEVAAFFRSLFSGGLLTESGRAALSKEIDDIQAKYKTALEAMRKTKVDPGQADTKPDIGTPRDIEKEVKQLEAQHKLDLEMLEDQKKLALAGVQFEKEQIKEKVALREVTALHVLELEAAAAAKEIQIKELANQKKLVSDEQYFRARIALAGSPEERAALQAQADAALSKNRTEGALLDRQQSREGLANVLKQNKEIEDAKKRTGESIVQNEASNYKISQDLDRKKLEDQVNLQAALVTVSETELRSYEEIASAKMDLLLAQFDLEVHNAEAAGRQTVSIKAKYAALLNQENQRMTNGFVQGWREALSRYVNDTSSMFGMAVDMARQTAQIMQQAFQKFFFDLFEGKINSMKDVLRGFLDFVKQVVSQVMAQLATTFVLKAIQGAFSGTVAGANAGAADTAGTSSNAFANQGGLIQRFSLGGPVLSNGDSVPAMLTPGEFVVSRQGVDALNRINQGQGIGGGEQPITVHIHNAPPGTGAKVNVYREMKELIIGVVLQNVRENGPLRGLMQGGS